MQIRAMENSCPLNDSQNNCSLRHAGAPGCIKEIEMARSEDRICARRYDLCISTRLMNSLSFERSMIILLKNVTSISPRRGASILATMPSKYWAIPRKLRWVRTGRTTRLLDRGDGAG